MTIASPGTPACGHQAPPATPPVCAHLRDAREPWLSYYRCFNGSGFDHQLLCQECADAFDEEPPPPAFHLCGECLEFASTEVGDLIGVRGQPEVLEEPDGEDRILRTIDLPRLPASLVDVAYADTAARWFGLCADGTIVEFSQSWEAHPAARAPIQDEPDHEPYLGHHLRQRLHVSPSGRHAAVVNDYGRYGAVVDLASSGVTIRLDGGDYYPQTVPFSLTFAAVDGRDVVVHRTAWNRLEVSHPQSGQVLTQRPPTTYGRGEPRPGHYLDYFHGRLYVSPDGTRLLDDGWVWHPIGIPKVWDLHRWLTANVWESEDGPSKVAIDNRGYYWDHGMCWIDSARVAVEGIGADDDDMVCGARIFDVSEPPSSAWSPAKELACFAGPAGEFFSDGDRLFTAGEDGLSVWNIHRGARIGRIAGFAPQHHARPARELLELRSDHLVLWRYG